MTLVGVQGMVDAHLNGRVWETSFYQRMPGVTPSTGLWYDQMFCIGTPLAFNYGASDGDGVSTLVPAKGGLYLGEDVSPSMKYVHSLWIRGGGAATYDVQYLFLDYLMYYPDLDMTYEADISLTNSVSLPRYTDGRGVCAMVVATSPYAGGTQFHIEYVDMNGQSRISDTVTANTSGAVGQVLMPVGDPFIAHDVLRVTKLHVIDGISSGLAAVVLVRPLFATSQRFLEASVGWVREIEYFRDLSSAPRIYDGAVVNAIQCPLTTHAATDFLVGHISVVWS